MVYRGGFSTSVAVSGLVWTSPPALFLATMQARRGSASAAWFARIARACALGSLLRGPVHAEPAA